MLADSAPQEATLAAKQIFRPSKRRKFYRKRDEPKEDNSDPSIEQVAQLPTPITLDELVSNQGRHVSDSEAQTEATPSIADILRKRKALQRRKVGIDFTNETIATKHPSSDAVIQHIPAEMEGTTTDVDKVVNRFAPQTGQLADVDKHMMAYIDSELAKRRQGQDDRLLSSISHNGASLNPESSTPNVGIQRQPAALGKLHEIDLGLDSKLKNIAMTEAAKRKLEGIVEEEDESKGKVHLRKDGKPWRGRRRRNSEDIKRDQLVEEVMKESRLEIYDEPEEEVENDDQAADDRIAEQFRREFMEAISSRRQRTGAASTTKPAKGAKVDDRPKGPKLGGSRSARAAMREQQEKAAKK